MHAVTLALQKQLELSESKRRALEMEIVLFSVELEEHIRAHEKVRVRLVATLEHRSPHAMIVAKDSAYYPQTKKTWRRIAM